MLTLTHAKMEIKPGKYNWKASDADRIVTVIKALGKGPDNREYVQIEESSTGIPWDECESLIKPVSFSLKPKYKRLF